MRFSALFGLVVVGGALALPSCKGDDDDDDATGGRAGVGGSAGRGGSSGKAGSSGRGGSAGQTGKGGSSGDAGSGGTSAGAAGDEAGGSAGEFGTAGQAGQAGNPGAGGGAGASGAGGEGGSAGAVTASSAECADFPATIQMEPTTLPNAHGALLCLAGITCRIMSNTRLEVGGCPGIDRLVVFSSLPAANGISVDMDWEVTSISAGTIDESNTYEVRDIPGNTPVTAVLTDLIGTQTVEILFEFGDDHELTLTSLEVMAL